MNLGGIIVPLPFRELEHFPNPHLLRKGIEWRQQR
jgi:hypothetical protein